MVFIGNSLGIVLVGDWNRKYIQPEWIANNVFKNQELQISVDVQGSDILVSYKNNGITISPTQNKVQFIVDNIEEGILKRLCDCINRFIKDAVTPEINAYGLNIKFEEEDSNHFSEVSDGIPDFDKIIESGYEIVSTNINRTIKRNNKIINMNFGMENTKLTVSFNEHHTEDIDIKKYEIDVDRINSFIVECKNIVTNLGYGLEGEEQ